MLHKIGAKSIHVLEFCGGKMPWLVQLGVSSTMCSSSSKANTADTGMGFLLVCRNLSSRSFAIQQPSSSPGIVATRGLPPNMEYTQAKTVPDLNETCVF